MLIEKGMSDNCGIGYFLRAKKIYTEIEEIEESLNELHAMSDARQENEIKWLNDNGFTLVKVEAPEALRKQRAKREGDDVTDEQFEHRTEQFVDNVKVDYVIVNDGTLDDLYRKTDEVMARIKSAKEYTG